MTLSFSIVFLGWWMTGQRWMSRGQDFPKPSISLSPSDMAILGGNVTIQCRSEKVAQAEFFLHNERRTRLIREAKLHEAVFLLSAVERTDGGVYWCKYQRKHDMVEQWSPESDRVTINIIDPSLTKPFIDVIPRGKLPLGSNVTIKCQSSETGRNYSLHKSGKLIESQKTEPGGKTTEFLVSMVRTEDAGSYSCQYHCRENPFVLSEPSDPVELILTDGSLTILWASCATVLFVVLFLLLLGTVFYKRRKNGSTANEDDQPVTMPLQHGAKTDHDGVTSGGNHEELTSGTGLGSLTYVALNHQPVKIKQAAISGNPSESCIYASVAKERIREGQ